MNKKTICLITILFFTVQAVKAQETEIKITLSEQFFEALLEAVFTNLEQPKVPLSLGASNAEDEDVRSGPSDPGAQYSALSTHYSNSDACDETVRLKREIDGVRTAVKFRNGRILSPIAFEGNYNPPLVGCIGFSGWAETTIDLSFDKKKNALVGNARVLSVNLTGTNGIGSSLITRIVQNSIDKKINPLQIIELERLSFTAPIQNTGKLKMEAAGIRHVVKDREIEVYLKYRFEKG